jgi:hypothetical protein
MEINRSINCATDRTNSSTHSTVHREHLPRGIDEFLELRILRQHLAFYNPKGRPSIDPELMVRMLHEGYCFGGDLYFPRSDGAT